MIISDDIDGIYHRGHEELNYRTMMWAALATLVALLLVICVILMLVWRYFRLVSCNLINYLAPEVYPVGTLVANKKARHSHYLI